MLTYFNILHLQTSEINHKMCKHFLQTMQSWFQFKMSMHNMSWNMIKVQYNLHYLRVDYPLHVLTSGPLGPFWYWLQLPKTTYAENYIYVTCYNNLQHTLPLHCAVTFCFIILLVFAPAYSWKIALLYWKDISLFSDQ